MGISRQSGQVLSVVSISHPFLSGRLISRNMAKGCNSLTRSHAFAPLVSHPTSYPCLVNIFSYSFIADMSSSMIKIKFFLSLGTGISIIGFSEPPSLSFLSLSSSWIPIGIVKWTVDPFPKSDSIQMVPPISSTNFLEMVIPRPVPPSFLVEEPSIWRKDSKTFGISISFIPTPVSFTESCM